MKYLLFALVFVSHAAYAAPVAAPKPAEPGFTLKSEPPPLCPTHPKQVVCPPDSRPVDDCKSICVPIESPPPEFCDPNQQQSRGQPIDDSCSAL